MSTVKQLTKLENGDLPSFSFPGGYSILYLCKDGATVCAKCANEWIAEGEDAWEGDEPQLPYINWEGPTSQCATCNEDMPSEYGDAEAD